MILIFEGADNTGKTTLSKKIAETIGWKWIREPNDQGEIGIIRDVVKDPNVNLSPFVRQLLHSVSHIYDYITYSPPLIMDRSWISALVYGKLLGLSKEQLDIIHILNYKTFSKFLTDNGCIPVIVVHIDLTKPLATSEKDYYESSLSWKRIRNTYRKVIDSLNYPVVRIIEVQPLDKWPKFVMEKVIETLLQKRDQIDVTLEYLFDENTVSEILWLLRITPGTSSLELSESEKKELVKFVLDYLGF